METEQKNAIATYIELVERKAEEKMIKTGKLEGSHYAAMIDLKAMEQELVEVLKKATKEELLAWYAEQDKKARSEQ